MTMRRTVNTICVVGIQVLLVVLATLAFDVLAPAPARADQIEAPDRHVNTMRVTYVEFFGRIAYVELNDGSTWGLRPCRVEDGRHCFWVGHARGNHIGRSFVVVRGTRIFTNRI